MNFKKWKGILTMVTIAGAAAGCSSIQEDEEAPRIPDRDDLCLAHERGLNFWNEEYFRLMNRDEKKVVKYTLPPLPDTLEEWEKQRAGLLQTFKDCIYGVMPPPPDRLELKLLASRDDALGGIALRREYRIYCRMNNGRSFNFDMLLYVPKDAKTPPPVFIQLNFAGNQNYGPDMDIRPTRAPGDIPGRWHTVGLNPQNRGRRPEFMNYVEAISRGYAVATACYGEIFPDNLDGFRKSIFTLFYDDLRPDCEVSLMELKAGRRRHIGAYSAWAWGYSRLADALEKIPLVDAGKLACVGHSRLATASLWAGVNDPRFKLVCCNNSGKGGAQLLRRNFGALLQVLWLCRPNWVSDNIVQYIGREDTLPVDQHQLLGLVAPRALYVTSSSKDSNADPYGTFLSTSIASKIWRLYGMKGLETDQMPPVDTPIGNQVRYHVKTGTHSLTTYDWKQFYNFADTLFKNK